MFGFGVWNASGVDINTGFVKINAIGSNSIPQDFTGNLSYPLPAGYTLDFLFQPAGQPSTSRRKRISVSGNTVSITEVGGGDYSPGTYPWVVGNLLAYAR